MLFKIVKFLIKCLMYIIFRLKIHDIENFPKEGAALVALNHKSLWDVPLCASVLPRQLYFMSKQELFKIPVLKGIIKWAGAFPVNRGTADIGAIKTAMMLLKNEKCVAIFPEGTRVKEGQPHEVKSGVAMIASKAKVPVIPVAIKGKYGLFRKIDIYVGTPIYVENAEGTKLTHEEIDSFSRQIMIGVLKQAGENLDGICC